MNKKKRVISIITNDEVGVINRITELLLQQGHNIQTINAGKIDLENNISKVNIVVDLTDNIVKTLLHKLKRVVPIYDAFELIIEDSICMEIALIKLKSIDDVENVDEFIENIINNDNIYIIASDGEKNIKKHISSISKKDFNNIILKITETRDYIDKFIVNYKDFIADITRSGELAINKNNK